MAWVIGGLVAFNLFMWMVIYYAQKASEEMGVTEYTNKAFYEPTVNAMAIVTLLSVWLIIDLIF